MYKAPGHLDAVAPRERDLYIFCLSLQHSLIYLWCSCSCQCCSALVCRKRRRGISSDAPIYTACPLFVESHTYNPTSLHHLLCQLLFSRYLFAERGITPQNKRCTRTADSWRPTDYKGASLSSDVGVQTTYETHRSLAPPLIINTPSPRVTVMWHA